MLLYSTPSHYFVVGLWNYLMVLNHINETLGTHDRRCASDTASFKIANYKTSGYLYIIIKTNDNSGPRVFGIILCTKVLSLF